MTTIGSSAFQFRSLQALGFLAGAVGIALVVSLSDYGAQAVIAVIFIIVLFYLALRHPLTLIYFLLLTGSLSWAFVTGEEKVFFSALGGLDLNGIRLIGAIIAFSLLLIYKPEGRKVFFTLKPYLVFLAFAAIGLLYTWNFNSGIRLFSKFLYPYIIFCVLLLEVKDRATIDKVIRVMMWGVLIALISIPVSAFFGLSSQFEETMVLVGGGATHRNPFAFYVTCMAGFCSTLYLYLRERKYLWLSLACSVVVLLSVTRIAIAALVVVLGMVYFRRSLWKGIVVLAIATVVVTSYGPLQRRMFYAGSDASFLDLARDPTKFFTDVNAFGRFPAWGAGIYNMFLRSPLVGMGTGSTTGIEYEAGNRLTVMHSEAVRILAEQGAIGTILYLFSYFVLIRRVRLKIPVASGITRACSLAVAPLVVGFFVICLTDNAFDYYAPLGQNIFTVAALALLSQEFDRQSLPGVASV
jgi:hypothetical protein